MTAYVCLSFRWRPDVVFLADQLALKMSCESQVKKAPIKTTKPQEFRLTKPKPRPPPMAKLIPQQIKCKPVSLIQLYTVFNSNIANQLVYICTHCCFSL
mgnify:CR=1 FL=1